MTQRVYMLDTDTSSYVINGRVPSVRARLAEVPPGDVCLSVVTRAELLYGLKALPPDHHNHLRVERFLSGMTILPWSIEAADIYAEIRHQLTSTGRPIGDRDMMIAAHAMSLGAVLATNNTRHHGRLAPSLVLENWASPVR